MIIIPNQGSISLHRDVSLSYEFACEQNGNEMPVLFNSRVHVPVQEQLSFLRAKPWVQAHW